MTEKRDPIKIASTLHKYPVLMKYCTPADIHILNMSVWDVDELLGLIPGEYGAEGYVFEERKVLFLNEDGDVIAAGGKYPKPRRSLWNPLSWLLGEYQDEQVFETMLRLRHDGLAEKIKLIVGFNLFFSRPSKMSVYHPPRNFTNLQEWLDTVTNG